MLGSAPPDSTTPANVIHRLTALCLAALAFSCIAEPLSPEPLFAATLRDLQERPANLAHYRGRPLVVNFWARWCAPCRAEIPELLRFRQVHRGHIEVIGIGIEDQAEAARDFARASGIDYPVLIAGDQGIPLMQALGNTRGGLPYTLFIDGRGRIVGSKLGLIRQADLEAAAVRLLER